MIGISIAVKGAVNLENDTEVLKGVVDTEWFAKNHGINMVGNGGHLLQPKVHVLPIEIVNKMES